MMKSALGRLHRPRRLGIGGSPKLVIRTRMFRGSRRESQGADSTS